MTLTPEQFNLLATKEDLKELEERLVSKEEFNEFKNDVFGALDGVVKKLDCYTMVYNGVLRMPHLCQDW